MKIITLSAIPNQSFNVRLGDFFYGFTIKEANGIMAATITRGLETLVSGMRITAGTPLIPYEYLSDGNFVLLTENNEIPYYTAFDVTQLLVYLSAAEIEALRAGT